MTKQPSDAEKIEALRDRLHAEQRRLILQAADVDAAPPAGLVTRIAHLEGAMVAIGEMIEDGSFAPTTET